jgi:signal transduction histidine kinase
VRVWTGRLCASGAHRTLNQGLIVDLAWHAAGTAGVVTMAKLHVVSSTHLVDDSKRRVEAQEQQAQKMEAIGRLAGGIAHDFNNLLTAITGYTELIIAKLPPKHPCIEDAFEVRRAALSAVRLTRQLLTLSRNQPAHTEVLDVNEVVARTASLLKRTLGEDITVTLDLEPGLRAVKADPAHLEQIVLNLAINARDAMPAGGQLLVKTSRQTYRPEIGNLPPGEYVRLTISDTGCGIPEEIQAHVFEPFFTTKGTAGTGLGLATVYAVVKQNGGHIRLESTEGIGTRFTIDLPESREAAAPIDSTRHPPRFVQGYANVLLVEDDSSVLHLAELVLRRAGHDVVGAPGARQAIAALSKHPEIDLVVTDVVMPEMSGYELVAELRKVNPRLRVVFMSGFSGDEVRRVTTDPFLQKPFTVETLTDIVRKTLDSVS